MNCRVTTNQLTEIGSDRATATFKDYTEIFLQNFKRMSYRL